MAIFKDFWSLQRTEQIVAFDSVVSGKGKEKEVGGKARPHTFDFKSLSTQMSISDSYLF